MIVFVNGNTIKAFGGPGVGGEKYWKRNSGSLRFIKKAQQVFNDNNVSFPDIRYKWNSSAKKRRKDGYNYAKEHYADLTEGLRENEPIRFITHSMGAAFAEGMADYFLEVGLTVDALIHFEPFQAASIESNGRNPNILTIDFQDNNDRVIQFINAGDIKGADHRIRTNYTAKWDQIHRMAIHRDLTWDEIMSYIDSFLHGKKTQN